MPEIVKCRSCGAPMLWVTTAKGKAMPIDSEPCEDGNVDISTGRAVYVKAGETLPGIPLYKSHFASCPNAKQHRKVE